MDALGMSGNRKMPKKVLGHKGMATFRGWLYVNVGGMVHSIVLLIIVWGNYTNLNANDELMNWWIHWMGTSFGLTAKIN
jgi:hypothetical protein